MASPKQPDEVFFEGLGGVLEDLPPVPDLSKNAVVTDDEPDDGDILYRASEDSDDTDNDVMQEKMAQQALRPVTRNNLFSHPEAHAFVLDLALLKVFQLEWLEWTPETLFQEIRSTFSTSVADVNRTKIMATMTLHVTDAYWEQWEIFENTILALNGIIPRLGEIQPPDVSLLMAGVDIANTIRKEEYSEEVGRYTAACFLHDNVSYAPEPLAFCQPYLSQPRYKCLECGKTGSALPPFNGYCDACSGKFDDHPFNFKPAANTKQSPSNVKYTMALDPNPTRIRFGELIKTPPSELRIQEVAEDIESAKLIAATDYMNFRRTQRDRQLSEIKDWMAVS